MSLTDQLRQHANASHAAYPQYVGYFDGWTLGQTTRRIRTKGGTDLPRGEFVLTNFAHEDLPDVDGTFTPVVSIYDPKTTHVVCVSPSQVVPVTEDFRHPNGLVWLLG
jgi:hypothetical protein